MAKETINLIESWSYRPNAMTTKVFQPGKHSVDAEVAEAAKKNAKLKGPEDGKRTSSTSSKGDSSASEK